jgi:hypothetical protein
LFLNDEASLAVVRSLKLTPAKPDISRPLVSSTFLSFVARVGLIPE